MKTTITILTISLLIACFSKKPEKTRLEGTSIPNFSLLLPDSVTWFNTTSISTGKPSVFFQYSPYCPYCKKQMKDIINNLDKLNGINFYLITLFSYKDMKNWHEEFQLSKYSNIITGIDTAAFAAEYFEATAVPYTAIYDKEKKFLQAFKGQIPTKQILETISGN